MVAILTVSEIATKSPPSSGEDSRQPGAFDGVPKFMKCADSAANPACTFGAYTNSNLPGRWEVMAVSSCTPANDWNEICDPYEI